MSNQAKVTSTEALETFRAALIVFLTKARRAVDDTHEQVKRTRQWLQVDQRAHWEGEFRRKSKQLEQAQQELMSAKLSPHQQSAVMARQMAVAKLQRDIAEAEAKLRKLKGWGQNYDIAADPIVKRMDRLRQALDDLPQAVAYLNGVQRALDAYAGLAAPPAEPAPEPSAGATPTAP